MRASGVVRDKVDAKRFDDVVGAVAVMLIEIQDAHALDESRRLDRQRGNHQSVEGAETRDLGMTCMMESRGWRYGHLAIADCFLTPPIQLQRLH
jgi:hypothetical protein